MFKPRKTIKQNHPKQLPPPIAGLNALIALMGMPPNYAVILENFFPQPDGLQTREGYISHVTGFGANVERLHNYSSSMGVESLWATTATGVYNATVAGAVGPAAIALTNGRTISTIIASGAGTYLMMVNGTDTLKRFDGTTWASIAAFGTASDQYSYVETYRQRLFFAKKNSLEIEYLAANSIAGTATNYPLGAIFRRGGYIVSIATWTVDGGVGPEDNLTVMTSSGEVAVFAGNDPATWTLAGVYYIGKPLGDMPCFKYGGDLLLLTETGLYSMAMALQSMSIDRRSTVTQNVKPLITYAAQSASNGVGWQVISNPLAPYLLINLPISPIRKQLVMHAQTGAWAFFSGYDARCFGRFGADMYFGTANAVYRIGGTADNGTDIVATMIQAPSKMDYDRNTRIELIKPHFNASGGFTITMGVASDFTSFPDYTSSSGFLSSISGAVWGTGLWGSSVWTASVQNTSEWRVIPDRHSQWKGLFLQVSGKISRVKYIGSTILYSTGGNF
jgi:hypothetical protein